MKFRKFRFPVAVILILLVSVAIVFITKGTKTMEIPPVAEASPLAVHVDPLPANPAFREFIDFMERELDTTHTVGAAYTIVKGNSVVYTGTFGETEKGSGHAIDEHTLFRLASVSKGFAGALACLLEMDGAFSLEDRVVDYYPGFRLKDSLNTYELTIKNLLSHTSGLVPFAFDNLVEADQELREIVQRLPEVNISAPPGELYGYQNVMFSLLDPIARRATGIPYQVLMQERVFRPLGMSDASVGPVNLSVNPNLARPHVMTGRGYLALDPHLGYYNVMPAAGINASISDMGQWLLALLGNMPEQLPDTIRKRLASPVIYTPLRSSYTRYWKPFRERYYSLGWRVYHYRGRTVVYHGGYIRGYRAEIAFCPEEEVGFAFLQNSPNGLAAKSVPAFLDLFFDYRDQGVEHIISKP